MDGRKDFTINPDNFGNLSILVDQIKTEGIRFVIILDPAIAAVPGYAPYTQGKRNNVFIQWADSSYKPENQTADDDTLYGRVLKILSTISFTDCIFIFPFIKGMAGKKDSFSGFF